LPVSSNVAFQRASDGVILGNAVVTAESSITTVNGVNQVTVTFDRDLPGNLTGAYVYATDPSWRGDGLRLERNTVQEQGFARGISLWGLMNTTLSGSYLRRTAMSAVHLSHSFGATDWLTPPLVGITLANNVIDGAPTELDNYSGLELAAIQSTALAPNFSLMFTSPNQNLTFTGNFIANAARSAFYIGNTTGANVNNNYLLNPNSNPRQDRVSNRSAAGVLMPIAVGDSVNVSTTSNPVDTTSGQVRITDTQYRELAAYAPGGTIRLNAYNLGALATPTSTLIDADGVVRPMTIQGTTSHALDVQIPAGAALGGAYVTLTSGGTKYFGTLFVDSQDNIPAVNGCTYEPSPSSTSVPNTATSVPILVVTQTGCSYQAVDSDSFVTLSGGGTGTSLVSASFSANTGAARSTTLEIAGFPITLTQAAAPAPTPTPTPLLLLLDQSGPAPNQATALDSVLFTRDPFPVVNGADLLNLGADRNTRVILFVMNLQLAPGETAASVVVNLIDSNNQQFDLAAEDVRPVPNFPFTQVIFRLPNSLPVGTCTVKVKAHGQSSNAGTIRIRI
jgi:hypothetical protein